MARAIRLMGGAGQPMHLVELGLSWPPDTFLREKLAGLAKRGVRVTVASYSQSEPAFELPGVDVVAMPPRGGGTLQIALGAALELVRLARRRPRQLVRLIAGSGRTALKPRPAASERPRLRRLRERIWWLWTATRLAPLDPDVVHFEWETAAVDYLPLLDIWGCPMVMSCHGGLDRYAQTPTSRRRVSGMPAAFARAAAVHCVSDSMRAEAIRHGLEETKAHVIRAGVDTDLFSPDRRPTRCGDRP